MRIGSWGMNAFNNMVGRREMALNSHNSEMSISDDMPEGAESLQKL
jgi:hypothetical protein